ncbi:MAG TPA: hypothetical protein VGH11_13060 [Jatrophihabitans sp.]
MLGTVVGGGPGAELDARVADVVGRADATGEGTAGRRVVVEDGGIMELEEACRSEDWAALEACRSRWRALLSATTAAFAWLAPGDGKPMVDAVITVAARATDPLKPAIKSPLPTTKGPTTTG